MRVSEAFPSNYIKAADLQDRHVMVVIDRVQMETIGDDTKPVLYFQGKEKGLVMNKTNANNIAIALGDETEDWIGKEIVLFPAMVDFQGRTVSAVRVRMPTARDRQTRAPQHPQRQPSNGHHQNGQRQEAPLAPRQAAPMAEVDDLSDEIPF